MATAPVFIDDMLTRDSVLFWDELGSEPLVLFVRVKLGSRHPKGRRLHYCFLCLLPNTCVCVRDLDIYDGCLL